MDSPSYLEPAIGLWDWIIWGRLGSNSSGIHRLLKAMWQCFHTLISVASPLTVSGGCQNKRRFVLDILTYMNIKRIITVQSAVGNVKVKVIWNVAPLTCMLVFTTWGVSPSPPAGLSYLDFQHRSAQKLKKLFIPTWDISKSTVLLTVKSEI